MPTRKASDDSRVHACNAWVSLQACTPYRQDKQQEVTSFPTAYSKVGMLAGQSSNLKAMAVPLYCGYDAPHILTVPWLGVAHVMSDWCWVSWWLTCEDDKC